MRPSAILKLGGAALCLACVAIPVASVIFGSTSGSWRLSRAKEPAAGSASPAAMSPTRSTHAASVRARGPTPDEREGRVAYDFVTTLPCPEDRGTGRFVIDAGFPEMFGCRAKDECSVAPWGALRKSFERRRFRAHDRGPCTKHLDFGADCVSNVCVVLSDQACSPGLFADAGPDERTDLNEMLGMPDAEPPPEERLLVITGSRASEGAVAAPVDAYWTPSFEDVKEIDSRLPAGLVVACDSRAAAIAPRLAAYRAQFVGVVQDGKRRILGNYVCERWFKMVEADRHWDGSLRFDTNWLGGDIQDGGECFFHFWYDPSDKSIHAVSVNGTG